MLIIFFHHLVTLSKLYKSGGYFMAFLEIVLSIINKKNISRNKMLTDLNLSKNSFVAWSNRGTIPNGETLIKIADYLDCSVDYLLGRTNNPNKQVSSNNFSGSTITNSPIVQSSNVANVIVNDDNNTQKKEISKHAAKLLEIFENLDIREQTELLSTAFELEMRNSKK